MAPQQEQQPLRTPGARYHVAPSPGGERAAIVPAQVNSHVEV